MGWVLNSKRNKEEVLENHSPNPPGIATLSLYSCKEASAGEWLCSCLALNNEPAGCWLLSVRRSNLLSRSSN